MSGFAPRAGFTLVELLLVLTLLSVSVGLVAPDLAGRLQRNRLEELSHRVSLLMREAYQRAVFSGRACWVALPDAETIGVLDAFPGGQAVEGIDLRPVGIPEWAEVEGLEDGWCARPEGFCDEGPVRIRDRETEAVTTLRFRPYDGELLEETDGVAGLDERGGSGESSGRSGTP